MRRRRRRRRSEKEEEEEESSQKQKGGGGGEEAGRKKWHHQLPHDNVNVSAERAGNKKVLYFKSMFVVLSSRTDLCDDVVDVVVVLGTRRS